MSVPSRYPRSERSPARRAFLPPALALVAALAALAAALLLSPAPSEEQPAVNGPGETFTLPAAPPPTEAPEGPTRPAELPWNLTLVNRDHPLPEDFQVPALTQVREGQTIDSRTYNALKEMLKAARAQGLRPLVCSSFRTWEGQERLYLDKVRRLLDEGYAQADAEIEAAKWVVVPGTSEHELGLAVDIVDMDYQLLEEGQEDTLVQKWLMEHCWEYGFILRYPTEKSAVTFIGYEPWHYRYVGKSAALEIRDSGLCLEEYIEELTERGEVSVFP